MLIIAKGRGNYVLRATNREIANLLGWHSDYNKKMPDEGDEIKVNEMYSHLYKISRVDGELNGVANSLEKIANVIRPIFPVQIPKVED